MCRNKSTKTTLYGSLHIPFTWCEALKKGRIKRADCGRGEIKGTVQLVREIKGTVQLVRVKGTVQLVREIKGTVQLV